MSQIMRTAVLGAAILIFGFVIYKLIDLNWFSNVTTPTLIVYSVITLGIALLLGNAIAAHLKKKGTK